MDKDDNADFGLYEDNNKLLDPTASQRDRALSDSVLARGIPTNSNNNDNEPR